MSVRKVDNPKMTHAARNMAKLLKMRLLVGIPGAEGNHSGSTISKSTIGYINELGDDELHIPARPFLMPGFESVKDQVSKQMALAAATVLAGGNVDAAEMSMMRAGLIAQGAIQEKMVDGPFAPLSPVTIYRRKHRKKAPRNSDKPLIDTSELRNAVTYVIDKG